jgi:hypothetical protein
MISASTLDRSAADHALTHLDKLDVRIQQGGFMNQSPTGRLQFEAHHFDEFSTRPNQNTGNLVAITTCRA